MEKPKSTEFSSLKTKNPSFRSIKKTDLYKDMYSTQTAEIIKSVKRNNNFLKINHNSFGGNDRINVKKTIYPSERERDFVKTTISSREDAFDIINEKHNLKDEKSLFVKKLNATNNAIDLKSRSNPTNELNSVFDSKGSYGFINKENVVNVLSSDKKLGTNSVLFKTSFPIISNKKAAIKNKKTLNTDQGNKFFCPYCEHCNNLKDNNLDNHIQNLVKANVIINNGFDYMLRNLKDYNKTVIDLFTFTDNNIEDIIKDEKPYKTDKQSNNNKESIFEVLIYLIETLIHNYPKKTYDRMTYKIVSHFLNALIEDKISLENVMSSDILENVNQFIFCKGQAFDNKQENYVFFDKELESLFDDKTKKIIEKLFEMKYIKFDLLKSEEYLKMRSNQSLVHNNKMMKSSDNITQPNNSNLNVNERKFIILFLIFIQILSEISTECKERAILLYKFFKIYFVEQERKWIGAINKMKDKIKYYKELCKTIMQMKNQQIDKIEEINDILFTNKLTKDNLSNHKILIHNLLKMNNEKREEIYLISSQKEILEKELNFWVYDFDKIKLNTEIRNKMKDINVSKLLSNIHSELSHKSTQPEERSLLINADRFLVSSGHRLYFYEQKKNLHNEIDRLTDLYKKYYYKKKELKTQLRVLTEDIAKTISKYETELNIYKRKLTIDVIDGECQTDLNSNSMNKIMKNHESVVYFKRLNINKLTDYIERIRFGCSRNKPISKRSLLNLIPEVYNERIDFDTKTDLASNKKVPFDEFFHKFMEQKFKLRKLVKKHCEETILSILEYSNEDNRIELVRRFLGIGEDKLNRFIFEVFLVLIKCIILLNQALPVSFYKLFNDDHSHYTMNTELCFEIYHAKLREFKSLANETRYSLLKYTVFSINDTEQTYTSEEKIYEYMLVNRFYQKSFVFLNQLIADYKYNNKTHENIEKFYESFAFSNKEFEINFIEFSKIFNNQFKIENGKVDLEKFFVFFDNKKYTFRIKNDDFVELSLNQIISEYEFLNNKLNSLFDLADIKKQGIIYFKEFEEIMSKIFFNMDTRWQNNEYFNTALRGQEKDFLTKEEFVVFALDNKEFVRRLSH